MNIKRTLFFCILCAFFSLRAAGIKAGNVLKLPEVKNFGTATLKEALDKRSTSRSFSAEPLSDEELSGLLWAAAGVNRPESGKRTAPSAMNMQEIYIYVIMEKGAFLYIPGEHALEEVTRDDLRKHAGGQDFVAKAPVNLIYAADHDRMSRIKDEESRNIYAAADTGFIGQNVYLYCASRGLATVFRGYVDKEGLAKKLKLENNRKVMFAQTVGWPQ
ncbi:MAG: SagB/ThcOx family dehydrogenase [Elusimicrobia bacterium]|nr:SagB/ThcOx family dehydrogenase [Elusimicrobiota bacterium]